MTTLVFLFTINTVYQQTTSISDPNTTTLNHYLAQFIKHLIYSTTRLCTREIQTTVLLFCQTVYFSDIHVILIN